MAARLTRSPASSTDAAPSQLSSQHAVPRPGPAGGGDGRDRNALEYEMARLPRDVTRAISWYMEEKGISQRRLAERMKITPGRVSQILSGDENLTLRTLAAVCVGLGAHFQIDLVANTGKEAQARPSGVVGISTTAPSALVVNEPAYIR